MTVEKDSLQELEIKQQKLSHILDQRKAVYDHIGQGQIKSTGEDTQEAWAIDEKIMTVRSHVYPSLERLQNEVTNVNSVLERIRESQVEALITKAQEYQDELNTREILLRSMREKAVFAPDQSILVNREAQFAAFQAKSQSDPDLKIGLELLEERRSAQEEQAAEKGSKIIKGGVEPTAPKTRVETGTITFNGTKPAEDSEVPEFPEEEQLTNLQTYELKIYHELRSNEKMDRNTLLKNIWPNVDINVANHRLDVQLVNLRKKLELKGIKIQKEKDTETGGNVYFLLWIPKEKTDAEDLSTKLPLFRVLTAEDLARLDAEEKAARAAARITSSEAHTEPGQLRENTLIVLSMILDNTENLTVNEVLDAMGRMKNGRRFGWTQTASSMYILAGILYSRIDENPAADPQDVELWNKILEYVGKTDDRSAYGIRQALKNKLVIWFKNDLNASTISTPEISQQPITEFPESAAEEELDLELNLTPELAVALVGLIQHKANSGLKIEGTSFQFTLDQKTETVFNNIVERYLPEGTTLATNGELESLRNQALVVVEDIINSENRNEIIAKYSQRDPEIEYLLAFLCSPDQPEMADFILEFLRSPEPPNISKETKSWAARVEIERIRREGWKAPQWIVDKLTQQKIDETIVPEDQTEPQNMNGEEVSIDAPTDIEGLDANQSEETEDEGTDPNLTVDSKMSRRRLANIKVFDERIQAILDRMSSIPNLPTQMGGARLTQIVQEHFRVVIRDTHMRRAVDRGYTQTMSPSNSHHTFEFDQRGIVVLVYLSEHGNNMTKTQRKDFKNVINRSYDNWRTTRDQTTHDEQ